MFPGPIIYATSTLPNIYLVTCERYLVNNANSASHVLHGVLLPAGIRLLFSADTVAQRTSLAWCRKRNGHPIFRSDPLKVVSHFMGKWHHLRYRFLFSCDLRFDPLTLLFEARPLIQPTVANEGTQHPIVERPGRQNWFAYDEYRTFG